MAKSDVKFDWWVLLGVIVLILVIILFLISLGKIDGFEKVKNTRAIDKERKQLAKKVDDLKTVAEQKKALMNRLDKVSLRAYAFSKYILASIYILINIGLFLCSWSGDFNSTLGLVLNYNQAIFILFFMFAIVIPRKPVSVFSLNYYLRLKIRSIYYSKTPALEEEIEAINNEINALEKMSPWLN